MGSKLKWLPANLRLRKSVGPLQVNVVGITNLKIKSIILLICGLFTLRAIAESLVLPVFEIQNQSQIIPEGIEEKAVSLSEFFKMEAVDDEIVRFTAQYTDDVAGLNLVSRNLDMALFSNRTPVTRDNILSYVASGEYSDSFIHRSVPGFVIQGGGFRFRFTDNDIFVDPVATSDPIVNEPGISNTLGTIAMAKTSQGPDTATSQWFVNTGENSANLDYQNGGFTVFARVTQETLANALLFNNPNEFPSFDISDILGAAFTNTPLHDSIENVLLLDKFIRFVSVELVPMPAGQAGTATTLSYELLSEPNLSVATVAIVEGDLVVTPIATGTTTITIRATDSVGNQVIGKIPIEVKYTFESWVHANFPTDELDDESRVGPFVELNGDGITNLQRYAQGLDLVETATPKVDLNSADIHLTFLEQSNATGVYIFVERSATLATDSWQEVEAIPVATNPTNKPGQSEITVAVPKLENKAFYRLNFSFVSPE